jgi:poly-gamma-glutamate capsule biosynthesis protein CapA/YwtB (metallophosphatase superfamily)
MVTLAFIGDIGLNDAYIDLHQRNMHPFTALNPYLSGIDLLVGNLECVAKGDQGENQLKRPRIGTTVETLQLLKDINLGLVSLATNHVYDQLEDGFQKTLDFLQNEDISFLGAGMKREDALQPFIFEKNGLTFCFLNYVTLDTNPSLPENAKVHLNEFQLEKCLNDLRKFKSCNFKIVLMHWGGRFEGGLFPDFDQKGLARMLIDNGADLIIGHHSHTLQPFEKYKGKYIFYSLGNFCFSDINFEGKIRNMSSIRERESVLVRADFHKDNYSVKLIPFRNENLILQISAWPRIKLGIRNLFFQLIQFKPLWNVYKVYFKKIRPLWLQIVRKDADRSLFSRIVNYKPLI